MVFSIDPVGIVKASKKKDSTIEAATMANQVHSSTHKPLFFY